MNLGDYLSPPDFVRHLHTNLQNRTCHWGFDVDHWRSYLHLSDPPSSDPQKPQSSPPERALEEVKNKFEDLARPFGNKRKVGRLLCFYLSSRLVGFEMSLNLNTQTY